MIITRVNGKQVGPKFRHGLKRMQDRIQAAGDVAETQFRQNFLAEAAADIKSAGKFSDRWVQALQVTTSRDGGSRSINVIMDIPYWKVFEFGATIQGNPMLWIPLPFAQDAKGLRARDFPGGLFRVDRKSGGKPLLLSAATGEPKYFGMDQVTIPQKFHLRDIATRNARRIPEFYRNAKSGR